MKVFTDTPVVRNARRGVMEFLLINHPLDCPICDQGGECDLQDQAMAYGRDVSRFSETKRAVKDKNIGPLVKTVMTRCIQCTRCIRFATEVAGVPDLGATGRGETMEVGTYVEKALGSELSGNLIDICPVGALTSRPYAFTARPWELTKTDSIDVLDATGVPIRIDTRGAEVLRIVPRQDDEVNEEWMGDRGRFSFDGLKRRRLDRPWIRRDGKLVPATWPEALAEIAARFKGRVGAVVGDTTDAEAIFALREMMARIPGAQLDCRQDGAAINAAHRAYYTFNSGIAGIEEASHLLIIGSSPRLEAPVINARIRKAVLAGLRVAYVGPQLDLTYAAQRVELDTDFLAGATKPMVILGRGALARADGAAVLARAFLLDSAALVAALAQRLHARRIAFHAPADAAEEMGALLPGWELRAQREGDLGARMGAACDALFAEGASCVVLIGADAPTLPCALVELLVSAIKRGADAAVVPALDGGYCAIALARPLPALLDAMPWSQPALLGATRAAAEAAGLKLVVLEAWHDVDEASDLDLLRLTLDGTQPAGCSPLPPWHASMTRAALQG
jgi:NADH-quinone oxidoreductase subunit G